MSDTRDDPRIRDGFASPEDLYDWARRDKDGRTPLWTACLKGSVECIAALAQ